MGEDKWRYVPKNKQTEKPIPRTRKITFRLTESEFAQISEDLSVSGLSISSLVASACSVLALRPRADLAVLSELRHLGGLLKHVLNESNGAYSELTSQTLRDLSAYARALTEKRIAAPSEDNQP